MSGYTDTDTAVSSLAVPASFGSVEARGDASLTSLGVRKVVVQTEEVYQENGVAPEHPAVRVAAYAVLDNPWVGTSARHDLSEHVERIAPRLAKELTDRLLDTVGGASMVEAFGKAAIVGTRGEVEHGGALIHTPYFGNLMREFLDGQSIICFADARGDAGQSLVVPMWHKTHAATRSHYQSITVTTSDAPRPGELIIVAAASTGPRPHPRIGDRRSDPPVSSDHLKEHH